MNKKVYRSQNDKMLGGVCGGIAEYYNIDSTIIRLLAVLLFFAKGIGVILYIISWIVIPESNYISSNSSNETNKDNVKSEKTKDFNYSDSGKKDSSNGQRIIGIALILIGLFLLGDKWIPFFQWKRFWPLILVGVGAVLVLEGVKDNE